MKLKAHELFFTKVVLLNVPVEKLEPIDGSPFKAVTMRRLLAKTLSEVNKAYEDKLEEVDKELLKTRDEVAKFKSDLEEIKEKAPEEKEKELNDYIKKANEDFTEATKHLGVVLFPLNSEKQFVVLQVEDEVEFELEEVQKEFTKNLVDKEGLKYFPIPQHWEKVCETLQ